ncbi:MAG: ABC transporter ATP-binding protein [Spartobacteria bacterium]|nr:ABC transporter ATP-binding protein [Spartobacteria bacterium]
MSDIVVSAENLGKRYHIGAIEARHRKASIYAGIQEQFRYLFTHMRHLREDHVDDETVLWALRNVSFELKQGDVLGIIGRNGAGKSTLLKLLSRITDPTEGRLRMKGRINSLLEVGTGFHPELTGKENIFMNAAIHGMSRRDIQKKLDEIIDFAEIDRFIDTPVKRYSSGMYTRLAFAVAANLEPDILIVDEVLAVGDLAFQAKCMEKMEGVRQSGRAIIFVSHNMSSISSLCTRTLVMRKGTVVNEGPTPQMIEYYYDMLQKSRDDAITISSDSAVSGVTLFINDEISESVRSVKSCEPMTISVRIEASKPIVCPYVDVAFYKLGGVKLFALLGEKSYQITEEKKTQWCITHRLKRLAWAPQEILVNVGLKRSVYAGGYDVLWNAAGRFHVLSSECDSVLTDDSVLYPTTEVVVD